MKEHLWWRTRLKCIVYYFLLSLLPVCFQACGFACGLCFVEANATSCDKGVSLSLDMKCAVHDRIFHVYALTLWCEKRP